ncbi:hypothetical protein [Geobacter sp. FeAm09]|uniref:hypothetical protein n=1 Tax=Geobacter sp. FeAm09 TaxID=2597769 RepID=UPI00272D4D4B|nr:hypothetical protein [Geobacter sp. FeAm09]
MKAATIGNSLIIMLGSASGSLAAGGAREDGSGICVWIFLGFCALIVFAQLMPVVQLLVGFAMGVGGAAGQNTGVSGRSGNGAKGRAGMLPLAGRDDAAGKKRRA